MLGAAPPGGLQVRASSEGWAWWCELPEDVGQRVHHRVLLALGEAAGPQASLVLKGSCMRCTVRGNLGEMGAALHTGTHWDCSVP